MPEARDASWRVRRPPPYAGGGKEDGEAIPVGCLILSFVFLAQDSKRHVTISLVDDMRTHPHLRTGDKARGELLFGHEPGTIKHNRRKRREARVGGGVAGAKGAGKGLQETNA
jgi:hypothetical protein